MGDQTVQWISQLTDIYSMECWLEKDMIVVMIEHGAVPK
ncbi:hypothetical protein DSUL_140018 [Desulfovibrionales bacterium]